MKIRLIDDRILVLPTPLDDTTKGGIIIPTMAKKRPKEGTVVSVGPGSKDFPMVVKEGDKGLYTPHSGTEVSLEGKIYLIMNQSDLLATI